MNRSVNLKCRATRRLVPETLDPDRLPAGLAQHAASCLRCQAEMARYRRLRRELGALAAQTQPAPATIAPRVEEAIWGGDTEGRAGRHANRVVATLAGAAAASVVAVAMWRRTRVAA